MSVCLSYLHAVLKHICVCNCGAVVQYTVVGLDDFTLMYCKLSSCGMHAASTGSGSLIMGIANSWNVSSQCCC
jgi:hypothetical protein